MANTYASTFDPVDVTDEKDKFGNPIDAISVSSDALDIEDDLEYLSQFELVSPQEKPQTAYQSNPAQDTLPEDDLEYLSQFEEVTPSKEPTSTVLLEDDLEYLSQFEEITPTTLPYDDVLAESTPAEAVGEDLVQSLLPRGVKAFSYKEADVYTDARLYSVVEDYMLDRYGIQAVEGFTKEEVVNKFFNNRRGVAEAGNLVRVLSEADYINV